MVSVAPETPANQSRRVSLLAQRGFSGTRDTALARLGDWLGRNKRLIQAVQWLVVAFYLFLVAVPAFLPLPARSEHLWTSLTLFAQFVFWGIWWPFVLLSMVLVGRAWCGILCPEGTLTEAVSARGRGRAVPHWLSWAGWPFVAFACTTIYGQLVSVYQYPKPVLVVLGGSTAAAIAVGYLYGRNKRVWCRYLCPVNGVFGVLSKLAPFHFKVDHDAWSQWQKPKGMAPERFNCAPLVAVKTMQGGSACHMCGRCSGFRGAVALSARSPNHEIVHVAGKDARPWETVLIIFGMMGLAAGAFHWTSSGLLVAAKQAIATWLVRNGVVWPLEAHLPWFLLTNYPLQNDALSLLDGAVMLGYMILSAAAIGGAAGLCLLGAARLVKREYRGAFHHLAQSLIPVAGCGVFLGLSSLTVTMLKAEGITLDFLGIVRLALIAGAALWALYLAFQIARLYARSNAALALAMLPMAVAIGIGSTATLTLFWPFPV